MLRRSVPHFNAAAAAAAVTAAADQSAATQPKVMLGTVQGIAPDHILIRRKTTCTVSPAAGQLVSFPTVDVATGVKGEVAGVIEEINRTHFRVRPRPGADHYHRVSLAMGCLGDMNEAINNTVGTQRQFADFVTAGERAAKAGSGTDTGSNVVPPGVLTPVAKQMAHQEQARLALARKGVRDDDMPADLSKMSRAERDRLLASLDPKRRAAVNELLDGFTKMLKAKEAAAERSLDNVTREAEYLALQVREAKAMTEQRMRDMDALEKAQAKQAKLKQQEQQAKLKMQQVKMQQQQEQAKQQAKLEAEQQALQLQQQREQLQREKQQQRKLQQQQREQQQQAMQQEQQQQQQQQQQQRDAAAATKTVEHATVDVSTDGGWLSEVVAKAQKDARNMTTTTTTTKTKSSNSNSNTSKTSTTFFERVIMPRVVPFVPRAETKFSKSDDKLSQTLIAKVFGAKQSSSPQSRSKSVVKHRRQPSAIVKHKKQASALVKRNNNKNKTKLKKMSSSLDNNKKKKKKKHKKSAKKSAIAATAAAARLKAAAKQRSAKKRLAAAAAVAKRASSSASRKSASKAVSTSKKSAVSVVRKTTKATTTTSMTKKVARKMTTKKRFRRSGIHALNLVQRRAKGLLNEYRVAKKAGLA